MDPAALPPPGEKEEHSHKNRLQEYSQRASLPLPAYQTIDEGTNYVRQFRSVVTVDGEKFISPCTFTRRRDAEQHVAKVAFESIVNKIKHEGIPLIRNDTTFCKIILHEYSDKMKMERPIYKTSKSEGLLPLFITSVSFGGRTYLGGAGRNKRQAEQFGACAVIEWILGQSDSSITMAEIIKSKGKLFNAILKGPGSPVPPDSNIPLEVTVRNHLGDATALEKDMHIASIVPQVKVPMDNHPGVMNIAPLNGKIPEHSVPPSAENPKVKYFCAACSGSVGGRIDASNLQQHGQLEGSTAVPSNPIPDNSLSLQGIGVKTEVPSEGPAILAGDMDNSNVKSAGKRSHKKNKGTNNAKKARTND